MNFTLLYRLKAVKAFSKLTEMLIKHNHDEKQQEKMNFIWFKK